MMPVFRMRVEEVRLSNLTDWGLLVRKSSRAGSRESKAVESGIQVIELVREG